MIEIEQATCKRCGEPIELKEIGPNKREWCSPACKQAAYRERENKQAQQRIAQLEQELAEKDELIEQLLGKKQSKQPFKRSLQERLTRLLEQQDWPALDIHYRVKAGQKEGRVFIIGASIDLLSRALGQLEEQQS